MMNLAEYRNRTAGLADLARVEGLDSQGDYRLTPLSTPVPGDAQ